jgi:hypothetical protein
MGPKGQPTKRYMPVPGPRSSGGTGTIKPLTPIQEQQLAALSARKAAATGATVPSQVPTPELFPIQDPINPSERFLNHMFAETGAIRRAPVIFFGLVLASVGGATVLLLIFFNWWYGGTIQSVQTQVQTLQIERDDALDRLAKANDLIRQLQTGSDNVTRQTP